ncbi:Membrane protein-like protein [Mycolicibacterium flavescens]|uniref:FUSC family protein n=1 Tax=Mycobacterium neumannii TaxID=2048551 RepID=UPI000B93EB98|nr:FUSC family protein [Mycobacterium neumannii]VEG41590.1 Membrane protein-like protein [Mycolicibacterium flavescens]
MPEPWAVVRSLLGVLAMASIALLWDSGATAVWAAGAGAVAGAVALQDSPGGRIARVLIVAVQMGAAVFFGSLLSSFDVVFIVVLALWCFGAGLQWAVGNNAGMVAAAGGALFVIAPPLSPSVSSVLVPTALTIVAGALQAGLIALWPPQRWRTQREALADAYDALATDARQLAHDAETPAGATLKPSLRDAFIDTQAGRRPEAYRGGHRLPERIMATLRMLRGTPVGDRDDVSRVLAAAAEVLDAIADHTHVARRNAEHGLVRLDAAAAALDEPESPEVKRLSQQLHEAAELRFPDLYRPDLISPARGALTSVRSHMSLTSPLFRHAVRLSSAVALAAGADRLAPVAHGYWIALTVLMVLRPETAHTYTRCIGRLAGIATGVVVASVIVMVAHPTGLVAAALATLGLAATYAATRTGYIATSAAVAASVVFFLEIDAITSGATLEDRLFSIVVGGGLAVLAHVALPDHALTRLHHRAGELLKTEIDYAATVVRAYVHPLDRPADAVSSAWQHAYRARAGFEAASGATRMESRELRRWLRSYRTALNAVTISCTALEANLPNRPPPTLTPEFVAAVDDFVDALRGAPPNPGTPWTVDIAAVTAAYQQVREKAEGLPGDNGAARVLVAEIGAITRALSGIAAIREPTSAR